MIDEEDSKPSKIREAITGLAELHSKPLSNKAAAIFERALAGYPENEILKALTRCLKDLPKFPTVADVISRVEDGHPGPDEAWGMIPKTEQESGVWTDEMREAYFSSAYALVDHDPIAARMAFKESYGRILSAARGRKKKAKWEISLGHDPRGRQAAARIAVDRGYLPVASVSYLLEDHSPAPELRALIGATVKALEDKGSSSTAGLKPPEEIKQQLDGFVKELREHKHPPRDEPDDDSAAVPLIEEDIDSDDSHE